ncbi:MAG: J domain-containing protein [Deltaproteobacteria bacterium]|nr:J domain-containing protein [Deltaproteobacteria bacterium]
MFSRTFNLIILIIVGGVFFCTLCIVSVYLWLEFKKNQEKNRPVGYNKPIERKDELTRLLEIFSLDDGATEEDIKTAYRNLVKQNYPRGFEDQDKENVRKFIEIKEAYGRLTQLKVSRFGRKL